MAIFKSKKKVSIKNEIIALIPALLFVLIFRSMVYEPYKIPSSSMKPNLVEGDYIFVSKFIYGISHHSFPLSPKLFAGRLFEFNKPERGDVIVFRLPSDPSVKYIKRLIGLPGDKVQLINGVVYINGLPLKRELVGRYKDNKGRSHNKFLETSFNGRSYYIIQDLYDTSVDNTQLYHVPLNHYFFLGDNRNGSKDSRFISDVGYIPAENVMGKAQVILFSSDAPLLKIWEWIAKFDIHRVFKRIKPVTNGS